MITSRYNLGFSTNPVGGFVRNVCAGLALTALAGTASAQAPSEHGYHDTYQFIAPEVKSAPNNSKLLVCFKTNDSTQKGMDLCFGKRAYDGLKYIEDLEQAPTFLCVENKSGQLQHCDAINPKPQTSRFMALVNVLGTGLSVGSLFYLFSRTKMSGIAYGYIMDSLYLMLSSRRANDLLKSYFSQEFISETPTDVWKNYVDSNLWIEMRSLRGDEKPLWSLLDESLRTIEAYENYSNCGFLDRWQLRRNAKHLLTEVLLNILLIREVLIHKNQMESLRDRLGDVYSRFNDLLREVVAGEVDYLPRDYALMLCNIHSHYNPMYPFF